MVPENYNLSMRYVSPSVVLAAVALVGFFSRLELRETAVRVTKALSPHTFGVFLFHTHTLILLPAIRSRFGWLATAPVWELVAVIAGTTALIFFVGIAAD